MAGWKLEARRQVRTSWAIERTQPRKEATREVGTDLHASTVQLVTLPSQPLRLPSCSHRLDLLCPLRQPGTLWVFTCYLPETHSRELADVVLVLTPVTHRGLGKEMIFFTQGWPLEAGQRTHEVGAILTYASVSDGG